jgi:hypothetical protein
VQHAVTVVVPSGSEPKRAEPIGERAGVVTCLADVHGNTVALDAVLGSEEFAEADAVAVLGCTAAGLDPCGTLARRREMSISAFRAAVIRRLS